VYCGKCGVENPTDNSFCYACGRPLTRGVPVGPSSGQSDGSKSAPTAVPVVEQRVVAIKDSTTKKNLVGIGGWLLFFCLALTVFSPLLAVAVGISQNYETIDWTFTIGLTTYGIYTGILLWEKRKSAHTHIKIYFGLLIMLSLVGILSAISLTTRAPDNTELMSAVQGFVRVAIYVSIWMSYLKKSRRVRATFGEGWF